MVKIKRRRAQNLNKIIIFAHMTDQEIFERWANLELDAVWKEVMTIGTKIVRLKSISDNVLKESKVRNYKLSDELYNRLKKNI